MPAPYSDDLREKAVSAVDRGEKKSHICRTLNISRNTLDLWLKAREERGTVAAKREYTRGPRPKIEDLEEFRTFANENGHLTREGMAQRWKERISAVTLGKALKRIGFTRKKKLTAIAKGTRKNGPDFSNRSVISRERDSSI